ncbi:MAG: hypothetical protein MUE85_23595 [Microscillaceae bacterium]|jgi:hypothetical protein|nr:hypothetical protein [Microscillaceae bacterium]
MKYFLKMRFQFFLFLLCNVSFIFSTQAQVNYSFADFPDSTNAIRAQFGYLMIGDQQYVGTRINPELTFGKLAFGLDVPIFFNVGGTDGGIRNEEYRQGSGAFRLLSYVRWGVKKRDKVFLRYGTLDRTNVGFGYMVNNYTNAASFERRKVGFSYDVRFLKVLGLEGIYSDFNGSTNLYAIRPYVRPLAFLEDKALLKSIEVGYTYITDSDKNFYNQRGERIDTKIIKDGINAWNIDGGLNIANSNKVNLSAFVSYGQIGKSQSLSDSIGRYTVAARNNPALASVVDTTFLAGYTGGSGMSIGSQIRIDAVADAFQLDIRLERLWQQDHFLPQFFDALYEIDKDSKLWLLANARGVQGTYGSLSALIVKKLRFTGGLQIPDRVTDVTPALVHLNLNANNIIEGLTVQANYIKGRLGNLVDAFKLDDRSLLTARAGYRLTSFLEVGVNYRWTYVRVEQDGVVSFKPTDYLMPYFGLNFDLNKKKGQTNK